MYLISLPKLFLVVFTLIIRLPFSVQVSLPLNIGLDDVRPQNIPTMQFDRHNI